MTAIRAHGHSASRLRATGILASERIKLLSVRSTWWCSAIAVAVSLGIAALIAAATLAQLRGQVPPASARIGLVATASTVGVTVAVLAVAVLAVLAIGGEYGTGSIRSTCTAVPRRWPVLAAKAAVVGVLAAVVGLAGTFGGYGVASAVLAPRGVSASLGDGKLLGALFGGAGYVVVLALLALGIGVLLRSTAAGIAVAVGLYFVVPTIVGVATSLGADWLTTVDRYLPTSLGGQLYATSVTGDDFTWWQALLLLAAWLGAVWIPATITTLTRDV